MTRLVHFFIFGNWLVALGAGILTAGVSAYYTSEHVVTNALLIGFGTLFMYNFQRVISPYPPLKLFPGDRFTWSLKNKRLMWVSGGTGLISAAVVTFLGILHLDAFVVLLSAVLVASFYAAPFPGIGKPLREVPYIKLFLITLVWILCCFIFPQLNSTTYEHIDLRFPLISVFYLVGVIIPFDMRDVLNDYKSQKTVPQLIGVQPAKYLSIILLLSHLSLVFYFIPELRSNYVYSAAVLFQVIGVQRLKPSRFNDMDYSVWLDGGVVLLGLALLWP